MIAIHAGGQRQADHPVVAAKRALGIDPAVWPRAAPDRDPPGQSEADQGGDGKVQQQPRLHCRCQVSVVDTQEQQRRHTNVEHQCRSGMNETVVDRIDAFKQHAHEQHGKDWRRDVQGLKKKGEHAGRSRWLSLGG
ncbi:hypothetical protein D3C79_704360 [compost metagenome]